MATRIKFDKNGELTLPRGLLEGSPVEEGTLMKVHLDPDGNVVLKPVNPLQPRQYEDEDLKMFAEADEMTPELEERLERVLKREPRLFRR